MTRPPPPLVALGAGLVQRALAGPGERPGAGRTAVTAALSFASLGLAGAAMGSFRRRGTTVEPFHPEEATALVTDGVYTVTRNPMYVGLAGLLTAHAVWRGSWVALAPVAAFVGFMNRTQIAAEEAALREKFGADFEAFTAATPRWLDQRSLVRG